MEKRKTNLHKTEHIWAYLFVAIPLMGFLIFTLLPLIFSVWFSLTDFNPIRNETTFVYFNNYKKLFNDPLFRKAIINTLILLLSVFVGMILGLFLGEALKKPLRRNKVYRIIFYLPAVSSVVAINVIFRYLFNNEYGLINHLFGLSVPWLGTNFWPIKIAIIIKNVWNSLGATAILYVAGLNQIDDIYYEAAEIDGASKLQQFTKITVPLVKPVSLYIIITGIIGGLQSFADAQLMAAGNREAITIVYYIWSRGIDSNRYGLASAASLFLGLAIMIITVFQFRNMDIIEKE